MKWERRIVADSMATCIGYYAWTGDRLGRVDAWL